MPPFPSNAPQHSTPFQLPIPGLYYIPNLNNAIRTHGDPRPILPPPPHHQETIQERRQRWRRQRRWWPFPHVQAPPHAEHRLQDGGPPGRPPPQAAHRGQGHHRHPVRVPEGEAVPGHTGGPSPAAGVRDRAAHAHHHPPPGDGVGRAEDRAGDGHEDAQEEASGRVRVGRLLQREEGRVRDPKEEHERGGGACYAAAEGGFHGRRRLAGAVGEGERGGGGFDVYKGQI